MRSRRTVVTVLVALICISAITFAKTKEKSAWRFWDVKSKLHEPFAKEDTNAIVLVFITTDCPIANYYQPTLRRLTEEFAESGVQFFLLHSDRDTKQKAAVEHAKDFEIKSPVILDTDQKIAKRVGARVTPEAFLVDREGEIQYRGRIDDLYADYGKRRRTPQSHDLKDAIESFLAGEKIETPKTKAVGCYIPYPKKQD